MISVLLSSLSISNCLFLHHFIVTKVALSMQLSYCSYQLCHSEKSKILKFFVSWTTTLSLFLGFDETLSLALVHFATQPLFFEPLVH